LKDYFNEEIIKGEIGTIVELYINPREAYEVEFVDENGQAKALLTLLPNELEKYNM
jgi:hypothetical protein